MSRVVFPPASKMETPRGRERREGWRRGAGGGKETVNEKMDEGGKGRERRGPGGGG